MENQFQASPQASMLSLINKSKIIFIVLGLIIITGSVFIGIQIGENQKPNQQQAVVESTASQTQLQVEPIATRNPLIIKDSNNSLIVPVVDNLPDKSISINNPLIIFNLSESDYKNYHEELNQKLVMPFFDYYLDGGEENKDIKVMIINRSNSNLYEFSFDTYTQIGRAGESGMLNKNPNTGKLNFWFPHCQGNCIFSENYKSKYIEVVKLGAPLIN